MHLKIVSSADSIHLTPQLVSQLFNVPRYGCNGGFGAWVQRARLRRLRCN